MTFLRLSNLINPLLFLCSSELFHFRFSAFFSPFCFGFLFISTHSGVGFLFFVLFFSYQNLPIFLQITEAQQFLNSHHTVTPMESQTLQELFSSHPKGQGCTSHIFLSPRNTCQSSPELCCALPAWIHELLESSTLFHTSGHGWESSELLRRSVTSLLVVFPS